MLSFCRRLFFTSSVLLSFAANGLTWQDLWWRQDQQAMHLLNDRQPKAAAKLFTENAWQGIANYRAQNFNAAESQFRSVNNKVSKYNLGNTYAWEGKYQEAISAYDEALKQDPNNQDAIYNRALIKKLLSENKAPSQDQHKQNRNKKDPSQQKKQDQDQTKDKKSNDQASKGKNDLKNKGQSNKQDQQTQSSKSQEKSSPEQPQKENSDQHRKEHAQNEQDRSRSEKANQLDKPNQSPPQEEGNAPGSPSTDHQQASAKSGEDQKPLRASNSKRMSLQEKERDEATDQWLQQILDDPGGLLRRKIMRDHLRKANNAEESL